MPEVRASLSVDLHRRLKAEAANRGMHLKKLIAKILEDYSKGQERAKKPK